MLSSLRTKLSCTLVPALAGVAFAATCLSAQTTLHVGPGQTYPSIQAGINAAHTGDTVLVAPGTYRENINFNGKAITVTSSGGAAVTTIDGGGVGPAVTFATYEPRSAILSNFAITHGGTLTTVGTSTVYAGPGILVSDSAPSILNNIVTKNYCQNIQLSYAAPLLQNNVVSFSLNPEKCSVGSTGGIASQGVYSSIASGSAISPVIVGNIIENNTTGQLGNGGGDGGAGIWVFGASNLAIVSNIIRNNTTITGNGGGIYTLNAWPVAIVNNLIYNNTAGCGGGAIAFDAQDSGAPYNFLIANNTLVDNTSSGLGGYSQCSAISQIYPDPGSYGYSNPNSAILNNIISGATIYPAVNCSQFSTPSEAFQPVFQNNLLYNGNGPFFGSFCIDVSRHDNNLVSAPQFVSAATGNYHLKTPSPTIDSGLNSVVQDVLTMTGYTLANDLDGNPRVQNGTGKSTAIIDMGAYETAGAVAGSVTETLTSSLNPSTYANNVTLTATLSSISGTPTGSVQFKDGNTVLGVQTVSASGTSTYSTSGLAVGTHPITAVYEPTGIFTATTASLSQVVSGEATTTTLTCNPNVLSVGAISLFSITVSSASGTPTGTVSITDNGTALTQLTLANGVASYSLTARQAGTRTIVATYVPTGSFNASSASCVLTVSGYATTATLSVAPTLASYGTPVTLTVSVSGGPPGFRGSPVGPVTFYNGSTVIASGLNLAEGTVSFTTTTLPPGIDYLTCIYNGNATFAPAACNTVAVTITQNSAAITLTSSLNPALPLTAITFTAQVEPGSSGTIVFNVNGQNIPTTPNAAGTATTTTSSLTPGSYLITATYFATPNALAAQASLNQLVTTPVAAPDFSLTGSDTTVVINHAGTGKLLVASLGSFAGSVALTCNPPYPPGYTCTLQTASVSLPLGFSTYVTYKLSPNDSASIQPLPHSTRLMLAAIFPLSLMGLLGLARKRRTVLRALLCLVALTTLTSITTACGPDHFIPITTGTYPLTFTGIGTSQGTPTPITHTVTIQATVQATIAP